MNRTRVAVVGLSVCLLAYLAFYWWVHASPLPSISKITSIEARIFLNQKTQAYEYDRPLFVVPEAYWANVLDALQPSRRDFDPMKWAGLGLLRIATDDGGIVHVTLYEANEDTGAFSARPESGDDIYYRGGTQERLRQVLYDAQAASR